MATLIEKYKDNEKLFKFICESYSHCESIDNIEGKVIEGEWCGYSITDFSTKKSYFVEEGIRGMIKGWFIIENGEPRSIPRPLNYDQVHHILDLLELAYLENGYNTSDIPDFIRYGRKGFRDAYLIDQWNMSDQEYRDRRIKAIEDGETVS